MRSREEFILTLESIASAQYGRVIEFYVILAGGEKIVFDAFTAMADQVKLVIHYFKHRAVARLVKFKDIKKVGYQVVA